MGAKINLTGQKFGKLTVLEETSERKYHQIVWKCKCDCNNIVYIPTASLKDGATKSCGCLGKSYGEYIIGEILKENNISYEKQKTFQSCRFKDTNALAKFDFYINNKYLIEYDGEQHFKKGRGFFKETLEKRQEHDNFKNQWCKENNIPLIRIPYTHLKQLCLNDLLLETSKFIT